MQRNVCAYGTADRNVIGTQFELAGGDCQRIPGVSELRTAPERVPVDGAADSLEGELGLGRWAFELAVEPSLQVDDTHHGFGKLRRVQPGKLKGDIQRRRRQPGGIPRRLEPAQLVAGSQLSNPHALLSNGAVELEPCLGMIVEACEGIQRNGETGQASMEPKRSLRRLYAAVGKRPFQRFPFVVQVHRRTVGAVTQAAGCGCRNRARQQVPQRVSAQVPFELQLAGETQVVGNDPLPVGPNVGGIPASQSSVAGEGDIQPCAENSEFGELQIGTFHPGSQAKLVDGPDEVVAAYDQISNRGSGQRQVNRQIDFRQTGGRVGRFRRRKLNVDPPYVECPNRNPAGEQRQKLDVHDQIVNRHLQRFVVPVDRSNMNAAQQRTRRRS